MHARTQEKLYGVLKGSLLVSQAVRMPNESARSDKRAGIDHGGDVLLSSPRHGTTHA